MRGTIWEIVVYEDDSRYKEVIKAIEEYKYAKITHDLDTNDSGEIKKTHTHIVLKTNQISISTLAKNLGIQENYIRIKRDLQFAIRYLWHRDQPLKYQYKKNLVETNCPQWLNWYDDEMKTARMVIELIKDEKPKNYTELALLLSDNNLFGIFRQAPTLFIEIWKENRNFEN